ncbi:MAG TPA: hypothetical protein DGT23_32220 [Micromonosporaceae bacterium]|nr:hypothetical protein [Micromonosporaceae bacterium]
MTTLHIEHAITGFDEWKPVFDRFAQLRQESGVLRHRIQRAVDDPKYVVIDLDFEEAGQAAKFLDFLETKVWSSRMSSPALVGTPHTKILETVPE